ncbi:mitochondrial 54S ribosomal protein YmL31 [Rhizodiscina lignyota]|uniref:Large ribosomal subunit protein mL60 n=1 Tax=Rhizodiscina lignyota TaxID=1504668 RepID=A0A9P4ISN0_9PEZI|nr:mitochondrial 54S ribosomal protein YmL31 [Rhizodiscina lignyota]
MFGPFRPTFSLFGGLLWKRPWRMSRPQKYRLRQRLRRVDSIVATVDAALSKKGLTTRSLERWKAEMPTEEEMRPKDKYTMFDRKVKGYRKGVHKLPKWTRISQRLNPPGY